MKASASSKELYGEYREQMQKIADVKNAIALLQWDQETYLPIKGAAFRAQQIATLSEQAHKMITEESMGILLDELLGREDLEPEEKKNLSLSQEDFTKQKKYPPDFVRTLSETASRSFHA